MKLQIQPVGYPKVTRYDIVGIDKGGIRIHIGSINHKENDFSNKDFDMTEFCKRVNIKYVEPPKRILKDENIPRTNNKKG